MKTHRLSVRLDNDLEGRLEAKCMESGCDVSDVVRTALALLLNNPAPEPHNSDIRGQRLTKLVDLVGLYRSRTTPVGHECRTLYLHLLAAIHVALERGESPASGHLCSRLLRIGREPGLLSGPSSDT